MPTKRCTDADRRGRLAKARQFLDAAELVETLADEDDLLDSVVTLCVHAGIAAADVVCCVRLGEHATGQNHTEAVELVGRVDSARARPVHSAPHEGTRRLQLDTSLNRERHGSDAFGHSTCGGGDLVVSP